MLDIGKMVSSRMLAVVAVASLAIAPVIVYADASAPMKHHVKKHKAKAMMHHRHAHAKPMAHATMPQPVEVAQAPAPAPMPEPVAPPTPVAAPEPVAAAPAAPTPAPVAVARSGGSGWILGALAAAAVVGGIVAADSGSGKPKSP